MTKIKVEVKEDGSINFDQDGYAGEACAADYQKFLKLMRQQGLKIKVLEEKKKVSSASTGARQAISG